MHASLRRTRIKMTRKERVLNAIEILKGIYPDALCSLEYDNPFELLVVEQMMNRKTKHRIGHFVRDRKIFPACGRNMLVGLEI